jgi:hypothetical protein
MSDIERLNLRGVKVVKNQGNDYVYLPSVERVFGGKASIIQIANSFMVQGHAVVDEIIDGSWNEDALRVLYDAHADRATGGRAERAQMKEAVRKAAHYRFVTTNGHRDYEYPEWKLGDVPLTIALTGPLEARGVEEILFAQTAVQ